MHYRNEKRKMFQRATRLDCVFRAGSVRAVVFRLAANVEPTLEHRDSRAIITSCCVRASNVENEKKEKKALRSPSFGSLHSLNCWLFFFALAGLLELKKKCFRMKFFHLQVSVSFRLSTSWVVLLPRWRNLRNYFPLFFLHIIINPSLQSPSLKWMRSE